MKIDHKKLIAREILCFAVFLFGIFAFVWILTDRFPFDNEDFVRDFLILLAFLYFLRAIVWAIITLFVSSKKQPKN